MQVVGVAVMKAGAGEVGVVRAGHSQSPGNLRDSVFSNRGKIGISDLMAIDAHFAF